MEVGVIKDEKSEEKGEKCWKLEGKEVDIVVLMAGGKRSREKESQVRLEQREEVTTKKRKRKKKNQGRW